MKRKMFFPIVMFGFVLIAVGYNLLASYSVILTDSTYINLSNIEALAQDESNNGYSCTVTVDCGDLILAGSVSCTGKSCNRGLDGLKELTWNVTEIEHIANKFSKLVCIS